LRRVGANIGILCILSIALKAKTSANHQNPEFGGRAHGSGKSGA
jgi:hypothetical protein